MRGVEAEVLDTCQRYGIGVITWGPLAGGWMSGRWRKGRDDLTSSRSARLPARYDLSIPANLAKLEAGVIERAFNGFKHWLGLATRYDKHATVYRGALVLAAALLWINDFRASPAPGSTAARPLRAAQLHPGSAGRRTSADTLG